MLDLVSTIPKWNARVDNYVVSIFGFVDKYLARDGSILFFYDDDRVWKEIKSYLENYNFKIQVCNCQQYTSHKSWIPKWKGKLSLNSTKASYIHRSSILKYLFICHRLSWTRFFSLCTRMEIFLFQGICNKDIFRMIMCSSTRPFKILWQCWIVVCLLELDMKSTLTLSNYFSLPCRLLGVWWWTSMFP